VQARDACTPAGEDAGVAESDRRWRRSIDTPFDEMKSRDDYDSARFAEKLAAVRGAV
jgi:hypothetical protein